MADIVYDWKYFKNKTPFRNILSKYADLSIDSYWTSSCAGSRHYRYTISYDQKKFIENISVIKKAVLKTKMCQYLEHIRAKVEAIPESLSEYANAYDINRVFSDLFLDGCMRQSQHSISYYWEVTNSFADDVEFNKACAKKMTRPMLKLNEVNGWERESWNFYFDYIDNELITQLSERLNNMPKVDQKIGKSYFTLNLVPIEFDSVNFNGKCYGYMPKHNLVEGTMNMVKLKEILELDDNGLFEFLYKGGIRDLFN